MALEFDENPDFEYIEQYLRDSVHNDFSALLKSTGTKTKDLKYINEHFELYNSAIKKIKETLIRLRDENEMMKRGMDMQNILLKAVAEQITENQEEIKRMKKAKLWGFKLF